MSLYITEVFNAKLMVESYDDLVQLSIKARLVILGNHIVQGADQNPLYNSMSGEHESGCEHDLVLDALFVQFLDGTRVH